MKPGALLLAMMLGLLGCSGAVPLEGRIDLFGTAHRPYLGMVTDSGEHVRLQGALSEELSAGYQGRRLRLRAILIEPASGPGRPAVYEVRSIDRPLDR